MPTLQDKKCRHHPDREAVARCPHCEQFYCRECVTEHQGRISCAACLAQLATQTDGPAITGRSLLRLLQCACALALLWMMFYSLGSALLALPDSFHDGTIWQVTTEEWDQ